MNTEYRYILEKGSKKHYCPNCNKKTFVRYIDRKTGDYLPEKYGRCDRESKCSYHLNPYLDGYAKMIWEQEQKVTGVTKVTVQKPNLDNLDTIKGYSQRQISSELGISLGAVNKYLKK